MSTNLPPDGPSEEEVRQYLAQMRGAPVDQVLLEVVQGLLNAAQVKLGRNDARLLIDACAALNDTVRGQVADELTSQVDQALSQLRLAQVEAEKDVAGQPEPNDLGSTAGGQPVSDAAGQGEPEGGDGPGAPPGQQQPATPPGTQGSQTSKLWIPGR